MKDWFTYFELDYSINAESFKNKFLTLLVRRWIYWILGKVN